MKTKLLLIFLFN